MDIRDCNSGIYHILNLINGFIYIGSSATIAKRWKNHKRDLREIKHTNKYLQAAWNVYGEDAFEFKILESVEPLKIKLIEREQHWIDNSSCLAPNGYNLNPKAGSRLGTKHTKETLTKLKLKTISIEHKAQISKHFTGLKHTEQTKEKIKKGNLGKRNTEEAKERMRQAWAKRKGESYKAPEFTSKPLVKGENGWI